MNSFRLRALVGLFLSVFGFFAEAEEVLKLRVVSANISTGRKQNYNGGEGIRIFQSAKPDIIGIQEWNYLGNTPKDIEKFVDETFGKEFDYYRETGPQITIPNGIISRFPIIESGSWDDPQIKEREFAYARVALPSGQIVWVISVHLHTKGTESRLKQTKALMEYIEKHVPKTDEILLAGDFNSGSENEDMFKVLFGSKRFVEDHDHKPEGADGKRETNAKRNKRYDYVLASPELDKFHIPVELTEEGQETYEPKELFNFFPKGLVFDTRVMPFLPAPALAKDSAAENMQHMMIVKDFLVPYLERHNKETQRQEAPTQSPETHD